MPKITLADMEYLLKHIQELLEEHSSLMTADEVCKHLKISNGMLQMDLMRKGLKNSSINMTLTVLKHIFSKAVEWEMADPETLKRIRKVKPLRDDSKRLRYLSQEE